jgi:DNA-binding transcriptional MerR regulator
LKKVADQDLGFIFKIDHQRGLTIGQLADTVSSLTGMRCTPAMIYNYEKHGLIDPPERTEGGFRLFRVQDIHRVACIKRCQAQGKTLAEIKNQLEVYCAEPENVDDLPDLPIDRRMQLLEAAMQSISSQRVCCHNPLRILPRKPEFPAQPSINISTAKKTCFWLLLTNCLFSTFLTRSMML